MTKGLQSNILKSIFLIVLLVFFYNAGKPYAEKLYEYRDENGVLHFSNIPPDTRLPVKVQQVRVSGVEDRVLVSNAGSAEEPLISVYNGYGGPVEMEISLLEADNMSSDPLLPFRTVVPANEEIKTVRMWPTRKNQSFSYRYGYRYCPGDPEASHFPGKAYRPPFQSGSAYRISQSFKGTYSHNSDQSRYAIDIAMPVGTPVCAARSGVVMDIANDFISGGLDREEYARRANFIRILHEDGTMALYAHLKLESIRVGIGRKISAGEVIAESGDTGYSSGPHLHFVIQRNTGMHLMSLPFKINLEGRAVIPEKEMMLRAD